MCDEPKSDNARCKAQESLATTESDCSREVVAFPAALCGMEQPQSNESTSEREYERWGSTSSHAEQRANGTTTRQNVHTRDREAHSVTRDNRRRLD